jgi:sugar phosphate isomerase/epimerase
VPLGLGPSDHRPYFQALRRINYDGRISIEANWEALKPQLPAALAGLRGQLER